MAELCEDESDYPRGFLVSLLRMLIVLARDVGVVFCNISEATHFPLFQRLLLGGGLDAIFFFL